MSPTGMRPRGREEGSGSTPTSKCLGHTSHRYTHHAPPPAQPTVSDSHCGIAQYASVAGMAHRTARFLLQPYLSLISSSSRSSMSCMSSDERLFMMMANTSAGSPAQQRGAAFLSEPSRAKPRRPLQQHLERRRLLEPQQLRRQRPPELVHLGGLDREAVVELPPSETTSHAPLRVLPHGIARELDRRAECLSARSSQLGIWESAFTVLSCVCVC